MLSSAIMQQHFIWAVTSPAFVCLCLCSEVWCSSSSSFDMIWLCRYIIFQYLGWIMRIKQIMFPLHSKSSRMGLQTLRHQTVIFGRVHSSCSPLMYPSNSIISNYIEIQCETLSVHLQVCFVKRFSKSHFHMRGLSVFTLTCDLCSSSQGWMVMLYVSVFFIILTQWWLWPEMNPAF